MPRHHRISDVRKKTEKQSKPTQTQTPKHNHKHKHQHKHKNLEQSTVPPRSIFSINHFKISISQRKKIVVVDTLQLWVKEDLHEVRNSDVILDFGQTMKFDV